jgi:cell wall-associated NlpC family hydrolase
MHKDLEYKQRAAVVTEARKWVGTPYHHEADIKGGGVDCGMLIVRCYVDTGVVPPFDPRPYPQFWYLHRQEEKYLGFVLDRATERGVDATPVPGDVVVWHFGRCFAHGGIVSDWPKFVHAYAPAGMCLEDDIRLGIMGDRRRRVFDPWGDR